MKYILIIILALVFSFFASSSYADLSEAQTRALISFVKKNPNGSIYHGGSGTWIAPNYILTCSHLEVQKSEQVATKFSWFAKSADRGELGLYVNNRFYPLTEIYNDSRKDITIYRSDYYTSKNYLKVSKNIKDSQVNTPVLAYGDFRNDPHIKNIKISSGQIINNAVGVSSWQKMATASVYSGFSGGPVINRSNNEIIGIIQQRYVMMNNAVMMLSQEELIKIMNQLGI